MFFFVTFFFNLIQKLFNFAVILPLKRIYKSLAEKDQSVHFHYQLKNK